MVPAAPTSTDSCTDLAASEPSWPALEADVAAKPNELGALLRIDVHAIWLPDAAPARLPNDATSVDVVQVADNGAVHRGLLTGPSLHRLVRVIDRLGVVAPGTYHCPVDRGAHDVLTFHGPWPDRRYRAAVEGCGFVGIDVGERRLPFSLGGGSMVDRVVTRSLRPRR